MSASASSHHSVSPKAALDLKLNNRVIWQMGEQRPVGPNCRLRCTHPTPAKDPSCLFQHRPTVTGAEEQGRPAARRVLPADLGSVASLAYGHRRGAYEVQSCALDEPMEGCDDDFRRGI